MLSGFHFFMKTVIITGASRGIGRETAIKFKQNNYNVVGTYLNSQKQALSLKENYGIDMQQLDASNSEIVKSFFDFAVQKYGKIDIVINNAGISKKQKFILDVTESEFDEIISVNVKGVFNVLQSAVEKMLYSGGKIVNISSIYTLQGGSCESVYTASKYAVNGLSTAVSEEVATSQLQVFTAILGLIDTDMNNHLSLDEKLEFIKEIGLTKIPSASDVADKLFDIITSNDNQNGKEFKIFTGNL